MMLDNFFVEWYLSKTILEEMAAARSRFMHLHADQNHFSMEKSIPLATP